MSDDIMRAIGVATTIQTQNELRKTLQELAEQWSFLPPEKRLQFVHLARATAIVECNGNIPTDIDFTIETLEVSCGISN